MYTSEFDSYIIYHEEQAGNDQKVVISCFLEGKTVGYITFNSGKLASPEVLPHGVIQLYYHIDRYREIINTLRFEKPLYLSIFKDKSVISTVKEPVGEQENNTE